VDLASAQVVSINQGVVTVTGSNAAETILVSQVATQIIVDIDGNQTPFDADDVLSLSINALGGNDTITVNVNRPTTILGGAGNDTITGSDGGADFVVGEQGADTFSGRGGDDTFVWNPGDGNDVIDGNAGNDTHVFNGSAGNEIIAVAPNGARVLLTRNLGNIVMDIGTFENITINALGGDDTVSGAPGLAALVELLTLDGGDGNDILNGGDGDDLLIGGDGDDTVDGNGGADSAFLGAGDDVFIWDPGDGSDFVEGEAGFDTLLFNGSAANEKFDASANGTRLRFTRDVGNIVMDVGTTEQIDLRAFGGDDDTTINDLDGTDVTDVIVNAGPGNDTFVGSSLKETFLGGEGDDTVTMGNGDFFDMGPGIDTLQFFGTTGFDNIHVDAKTNGAHDKAFFHGTLGNQKAVFENGEIVIVFTQGGDDQVKVHTKASNLWDVQIVE
jgi:Ca2+-binding RTX toxin-like protein